MMEIGETIYLMVQVLNTIQMVTSNTKVIGQMVILFIKINQ